VDVLVRIERLVIARRVEFTMKATEERLRDGLSVEDVIESIVNANAIKKVLRSRSAGRVAAREHLYVIESPTFTGTWIYTKGTLRRKSGRWLATVSLNGAALLAAFLVYAPLARREVV
jgi:hypothetical protein